MVKYSNPAYYRQFIKWDTITEAQAIEFQRQHDECLASNKVIHDGLVEKLKQAKTLIMDIFGEKSLEAKYFEKKRIQPVPTGDPPFARWKKLNDERLKKEADDHRQREQTALHAEKTQRAIIWLQARGKVLGTDFTITNAYHIANNVAFDERVAEIKGTYISFAGDEWCEDCRGFDGLGDRCECGNRRVSYSMPDYADFEDMYVIAEAY